MSKLDWPILAITCGAGLLSILALAGPELVRPNSFLMVPFFLISPAMTAFIYLASFALGWFAFRRWNHFVGAAAGAVVMWLVTFQLPAHLNRSFAAEDRTIMATDQAGPMPLLPGRIIALVSQVNDSPDRVEKNPYAISLALLFFTAVVQTVS